MAPTGIDRPLRFGCALRYDEVSPDQVMAAFKHSVEEYASMLAAQKPTYKVYRPPQRCGGWFCVPSQRNWAGLELITELRKWGGGVGGRVPLSPSCQVVPLT